MESRNLIIFSDQYPFNKINDFLDLEIEYLKSEFDQILVIALCDGRYPQRSVPDNVIAVNCYPKLGMFDFARVLRIVMTKDFRKELRNITLPSERLFSLSIILQITYSQLMGEKVYAFTAKKMKSLKLDPRATVAYSFWMNAGAHACALMRRSRLCSRAVSRIHGYDLYFERSRTGYLPFRNMIAKYLDYICFEADPGREYFKKKIESVDVNKLRIDRLGTADMGLGFPSTDGVFRIVSCSMIIPLKRIELIIKTLSKISTTRIHWTHIGEGPLSEELSILAQCLLKCRSNISYEFLGFLENQEILKYYHENPVDLFITLSETEGVPVSIMEALSFGIPVIATSVGGIPEQVDSGCGQLVPVEAEPEKIAAIIDDIATLSSSEIAELRTRARLRWEDRYCAGKNYRKFASFLKWDCRGKWDFAPKEM